MKVGAMFPSQYLKASDLEGDTTLTIKGARMEDLKSRDGTTETKPVLHFTDEKRTLILNKTNANAIAKTLGSEESSKWKGKQITLYSTEVEFGADIVDAIRVRPKVEPQDAPPSDEFGDDDIPF